MAGLLTPVTQVCCRGGSGTPRVPTCTYSAAVTKPKQRHTKPQLPPLGTSVTGRTMLFAHIPEAGLG